MAKLQLIVMGLLNVFEFQDANLQENEGRDKFVRDSVAKTSIYMGKAIILNILDVKCLSQYTDNVNCSDFHCNMQ